VYVELRSRPMWSTVARLHKCTGCSKKTDPLVYFDDNFCKYGPILTIFSLIQQEIHDAHKLSYFSHLTFIMLPLYLAKQTPMLVSMWIFLDHATKQISMYSNRWNIYLLIYSNALWCHYYVIIVFARIPFDCPVLSVFWSRRVILVFGHRFPGNSVIKHLAPHFFSFHKPIIKKWSALLIRPILAYVND